MRNKEYLIYDLLSCIAMCVKLLPITKHPHFRLVIYPSVVLAVFCSICGEEKLKCEDDSTKITAILNNCSVYCNSCKAFIDNDEVTAVISNSDEYRILGRTCEMCGQ